MTARSDNRKSRLLGHFRSIFKREGAQPNRKEAACEKAEELTAIEENQKLARKPNPLAKGEERARGSEPVEPLEAVENQGEFPTLTDQGEEQTYPKRRAKR